MAKNDSEAAKPKTTVTAKLRCLDHRNETVNTRWGAVSFDEDGLAELEVPEAELQMLRDVKPHSWLAEDHTTYQAGIETKREIEAKADAKSKPKDK